MDTFNKFNEFGGAMVLATIRSERKLLYFLLACQFLLGLALVVKIASVSRVPMMPEGVRYAGSFSEGLARVGNRSGCGYINSRGVLVIPCQYDEAWDFSDGYAMVRRDGKTGFINHAGVPAFPLSEIYSRGFLGDFHQGLAVFKGKKSSQRMIDGELETEEFEGWGFIGVNGKWRIDPVFDFCGPFSCGMAVVKYQGHWGMVSLDRKLKVFSDYESLDTFREGLAAFKRGGKWGFIDITGKEVIANQFDWAEDFQDGFSEVQAAEPGLVTRSGKFLTEAEGAKWKASQAKAPSSDLHLAYWRSMKEYPCYVHSDGRWAIRPNVPWKVRLKSWYQKL